jgi:hypothetical protein
MGSTRRRAAGAVVRTGEIDHEGDADAGIADLALPDLRLVASPQLTARTLSAFSPHAGPIVA